MASDDGRGDGRFHGVSSFLGGLSRLARKGEDALAEAMGRRGDDPSPYVIVRRQDAARARSQVALGLTSLLWGGLCLLASAVLGAWSLVVGVTFGVAGWLATRRGHARQRMAGLVETMSRRLGTRESVGLAELGAMAEMSPGELRRGLADAIHAGLLPEGRVAAPLGKERLYLTDAAYEADCALRDARASGKGADWDGSWETGRTAGAGAGAVGGGAGTQGPAGDAAKADRSDAAGRSPTSREQGACASAKGPASTGDAQADAVVATCADYAARLGELAGKVGDAEVASSLSSISSKVAGMADYVRRHPDTAPQLRRLTTYYLPTTAELASSYAELERQGSGDNASSTRDALRSTLASVDGALSRLSDGLLQDQALDLKADMEVMRRMLEQDGLSQEK